MEKRNLKKIIKELKILLDELESEVYSDPSVYVHPWYEQMDYQKDSRSSYKETNDDDGEYN